MKVIITLNKNKKFFLFPKEMRLEIKFVPDPKHDETTSKGFNAGKLDIKLQGTVANFYFPFSFKLPHPDLIALACIKIISPYVGKQLELEQGVSPEFAEAVKEKYGFSLFPIDQSLRRRVPPSLSSAQWGVSFSGGADSVAASLVMPDTIPLIFAMRTQHTSLPAIEKWYKVDGNLQSLNAMPDSYHKIAVKTDFEYLSTNDRGSWCVYPDSYAFTIPAIFLADRLNLVGIITGDIWAGFTGDESILKGAADFTMPEAKFFNYAGLKLDYPLNGVSEFGSAMINRYYGYEDITTTCAYGEYQDPCGVCKKCFRKILIAGALNNKSPSLAQLKKFEASEPIKKYLTGNQRSNYSLFPTYRYINQCLGELSSGGEESVINDFFEKVSMHIQDATFVTKYHPRAYKKRDKDMPDSMTANIKNIFEEMNESEVDFFDNFETVSLVNKE